MKIRFIAGLSAVVLSVVGMAACGDETCTTTADCTTAGDVCNIDTGLCVAVVVGSKCSSAADCTVAGATCDLATGECVAPAGCTKDADCTVAGDTCDLATGECVAPAGCTKDADCTVAGDTCDTATGECVPATGPTCQECACVNLLSAGGCADKCKMGTNGTSTPNFCDGVPALSQCAACLATSCASAVATDPTSCQ